MSKKIGIGTGGGDAPGLNAVIRGIVKHGTLHYNCELFGIEECLNGLQLPNKEIWSLDRKAVQGLLSKGGTILGTTNRGNPFGEDENGRNKGDIAKERFDELGLDGLILIGGDGTQLIGHKLMTEYGIPVIGVPKTIDNDLAATDFTFGFWSAVGVATEALDRLNTTAESHDRIMILEVMGRTAGWIALYAGVAGDADCIVVPEIPWKPINLANKVEDRRNNNRNFTLIIVAEGAKPHLADLEEDQKEEVQKIKGAGAQISYLLEKELEKKEIDAEIRVTVLGHIQRGGSPIPFDRVLATQYGVKAIELAMEDRWGELVVYKGGEITSVPVKDVVGAPREIDPSHQLVQTARNIGITFGDEN